MDAIATRKMFVELCLSNGGFAQIARDLDCSRQMLYHVAAGGALSVDLAKRIDKRLGVPWAGWFQESESAA